MRTRLCLLFCLFFILTFWSATPALAQLPTATPTPHRSTIYLPVISGQGAQLSPGAQGAQQGGPVYGLVGRLREASGQTFGNYLITNNDVVYGLVGATAALEQQIGELRDRQPPILVKIWGNIYIVAANTSVIVATDLLAGDLAPTPTVRGATTHGSAYHPCEIYAGRSLYRPW